MHQGSYTPNVIAKTVTLADKDLRSDIAWRTNHEGRSVMW